MAHDRTFFTVGFCDETTCWLLQIAEATGVPVVELVRLMLDDIRRDDEAAHGQSRHPASASECLH